MKLFKNLVMYCIIIIIIMSLTSSFELTNARTKNISKLSIKSDKMHEIFYNNINNKKTIVDKEEANDPSTSDTPEISIDTSKEYNVGDSGEEVYRYQQILYYMNYIQNSPDGNFGDEMKSAIESYQTAKKLEVTGKLDSKTQQSLLSDPLEYKQGKTGDAIKEFQMILYYLDYIQFYPEGEYGSSTELSVKKYQSDNSLELTGTLNSETQNSLKKEVIVYKPGKKGNEIKEYQAVLITLGYLSGIPDGQFGIIGSNALKIYQKNNNLEETGIIDIPTQTSLKKPIDEQVKF